MKKAIGLDLDGLLILRTKNKIYYRKNMHDFLDFCFNSADVFVFTSTTKKNVDLIIPKLFTPGQILKLLFIWDRSYTDPDPMGRGWDTLKDLNKIKKEYPDYSILMIDDSPNKLRYNQSEEYLICEPFESTREFGDVLLNLIELIKLRLKIN